MVPALLLALAACSGDDSKGIVSPSNLSATDSVFSVPTSLTITPNSATVSVGRDTTLSAIIRDQSGQPLSGQGESGANWYSSDTTVAKVDVTKGIMQGVHAGRATITAVSGSVSAEITVLVSDTSQTSASTVTGTTGSTPNTTTSTTSGTPATSTTSTTTTSAAGQGLSGLALASDNFSQYSGTAAFLANVSSNIGGTGSYGQVLYSDGANANLAQIDPTVQYNGHATLKYNQPGGTSNTPELWVSLPQSLSVMWMRAKIRFGPGFTTTGTLSNSANAYKLFGWAWDTYYGSGRIEITNTNQYQDYWTMLSKSTSSTVGGGTNVSGGNVTTEWSDGAWYDYIVEVDFSRSPGVARLWIARDGQTPVLRATSSGTMQSGLSFPKLTNVNWGMNFNQVRAADQSQALWYGQWEVVDGVAHPDPFHLGVQ